ncbi:MAG: hypothetical protein ACKVS6_01125 [Planctomycetota bacterium]
MKQAYLFIIVISLAFLSIGCAAIFGGEDTRYRVRTVPGSQAYETSYRFERGSLTIRAFADDEDGAPAFHFEVANKSTARITFYADRIRLVDGKRESPTNITISDANDTNVDKFTILGYEARNMVIRPVSDIVNFATPWILEVRGARDDRSEGGFDFDLFCEVIPEESSGAKPPSLPGEQEKESRRPLHDSTSETPGASKKK